MRIDLETVRPFLESLYSSDPRGRKPYDLICMLRSLLLMILLRHHSITNWAKEMRAKPRLAVMSGFKGD